MSISVVFFITSRQIITRHVLEQDQFLVEQLSINLASQLNSMEELQFNQYRYSLLANILSHTPISYNDELSHIRRISESLIRLCYSNIFIEGVLAMDLNGKTYNYSITNTSNIAVNEIADTEELLERYGRALWTIDSHGRLLMHRLLVNISTTWAVGQITIAINPRFLTGIYENDLSGRGYALIFDREGNFIPSKNAHINNFALLLFESSVSENDKSFTHNGERYIVSRIRFPENDFELFYVLSLRDLGIYTRTLPLITSFAAIAAVIATIIVAHIISMRVTGSINLLTKGIRQFASGDLKTPVQVKSMDEIGYLAVEFNRMADSINQLINNIYDVELKKRKAETNALRFEYSALETKINPHFIYNTLESINSLAKLKGIEDISKMVCLLGNLLRDNISSAVESVPLEKEIDNISRYLQIQKLAYGEKFDIHITIHEEAQEAMVPKFILQPLVENAIIHGILVSVKRGNLFLNVEKRGENLCITLQDDGIGMNREKLLMLLDYSVEAKNETGTHTKVGVRAVDKRLKILYGEKYGLRIESDENTGTTVNLVMPFFTVEEESKRLINNV